MIINYVHVHYANFALIIVMNLTNFNNILTSRLLNSTYYTYYWNVPCGDTSSKTLIDVCVCVYLSADISLNCTKNDSTDYPEILWVCWV